MNVKKMLQVCAVLGLVAGVFVARSARANGGNGLCAGALPTLCNGGNAMAFNTYCYMPDGKSWAEGYTNSGVQEVFADKASNNLNCVEGFAPNTSCLVHDSTNDGASNYDNSGDCNGNNHWYGAWN
jgi:hypothetical protein